MPIIHLDMRTGCEVGRRSPTVEPCRGMEGLGPETDESRSVGALKGILLRAETDKDGGHRVALKILMNSGTVKKTDMSASEAIRFVRDSRNMVGEKPDPGGAHRNRGLNRAGSGRPVPNMAVVNLICAGMSVGDLDSDTVARDPGAACELIASCMAAMEDASLRASALEMLLGCASAGVRLDAETLLCPDHTGHELLQQAKEIVSQVIGLPRSFFPDMDC